VAQKENEQAQTRQAKEKNQVPEEKEQVKLSFYIFTKPAGQGI